MTRKVVKLENPVILLVSLSNDSLLEQWTKAGYLPMSSSGCWVITGSYWDCLGNLVSRNWSCLAHLSIKGDLVCVQFNITHKLNETKPKLKKLTSFRIY